MQKQNPLLRVWELGKSQHSGLICAVISAFLGVLGGMLPYFAAAQMIVNLLEGNRYVIVLQMAVHWDGRLFSADTALYLGAVHIT